MGGSIELKQISHIGMGMKDEDCIEKVTIIVFPPMEGVGPSN